jgi:8-oxo-dGTP pyrophosphatase MutT (NUDIX family)
MALSREDTGDLTRKPVVTAFLMRRGKILILRRSTAVGSYRERWSAVSGHLEEPTPLAQALREIREETGLREDQLRLVRRGTPLEVPAPELATLWIVHPFLFEVKNCSENREIRLDWENTEMEWVTPEELGNYPTVPRLTEALARCF